MIRFYTDVAFLPTKPVIGDMFKDEDTDDYYIFTNEGWLKTSKPTFIDPILKLRAALEVYADEDNWIGNEFWAEGDGDPKRFAREALKKV